MLAKKVPLAALAAMVLALGLAGCGGGGGSTSGGGDTGGSRPPPRPSLQFEYVVDEAAVWINRDGLTSPLRVRGTRCHRDYGSRPCTVSFSNNSQYSFNPADSGWDSQLNRLAYWEGGPLVINGTVPEAGGRADVRILVPVSFGRSVSTNPDGGSATWTGVMAGYRYGRGSRYGEYAAGPYVAGNATLRANFSRGDVDVSFTNIFDFETGGSVNDMTWHGLSMNSGRFSGSGIEGRFFGPAHEEAGGVFDRANILGSFGVRR